MLVVCIRMYPYVPYVTRMLLVCYPYVLVWCFSHDPENEIIYILMYFIETRQLGLEPESARKDKLQTRSATNYLYVL